MRFMTALRRCRRTSSATRRAVFDCFAAFRPGTREPPAVALRRALASELGRGAASRRARAVLSRPFRMASSTTNSPSRPGP